MNGYDYDALFGLIGIGMVFGTIAIGLAICYVVSSLLRMKIFKMAGYEKPAYAWIPFYSDYILCSILSEGLDKVHVFCVDVPANVYKWLWLILYAVDMVVSCIPFIGSLAALAISVIFNGDQTARIYALMSGKRVEDETGLAVASVFIPIIYLVIVLVHSVDGSEQVRYRESDTFAYRDVN